MELAQVVLPLPGFDRALGVPVEERRGGPRLVTHGLGDDEVVALVVAGRTEMFRVLVERHYARCLRYAVRMLGDRADAEEVVQDAFVRAYRYLGRYEPRGQLAGWIFRIVFNECRSAGAKRRRRWRRFVAYDEVADDAPASAAASRGAEECEFRLEVQRALDRLPPHYREALLLKYLDDRTYEDMAELLGEGVSAVKMRVKRARDLLQRALGGMHHA